MKAKITLPFLALLFLPFSGKISAQTTRHVPADFATIQSAIAASQDGDTVLVQPGKYFENLRFHGKSIVLTSRFYLSGSADDIANTIINGSQPAHPDSASCILMIDGESPATVVQGFTITGGGGTKWLDEHGAGTYREGGGILTAFTSPTIQFNIIRNNSVTVTGAGVVSTGGGGIRCGDAAPVIRNNWIHHNLATGYGGGVVMNYCAGKIYNNVVSHNEGGQNFGGGGLWLNGESNATAMEVFNNTVAQNKSVGGGTYGGKGGGMFVFGIVADTRNNIFWGNTQSSGGVLAALLGATILVEYSDVQGDFTGAGNFNLDPLFADTICFSLKPASPAVDAGDPADNDLTANGLSPVFPALCGLRNDAGATGGQWASALPCGLKPARLFSKITEGALVSTPADSRSVSFVDVNGDGWEDIFITNGPQAGALNHLYLNDGTGKFSAATTGDIVSHAKPFDGATFADADNDGDLDAYAVTWYGEKNFLYFGNGDGTFNYLNDAAPSTVGSHSETASWGDYDLDGDVDLYVTNSGGDKKNLLFRNDHVPPAGGVAGGFVKISTGAPVSDAFTSRSVNWTDFDGDGDLDLYVSNEESQPDNLYRNDQIPPPGGTPGGFLKLSHADGAPGLSLRSSMSSSWGDVDNDGDLDLFVANSEFFTPQNNQLFKNDGDGTFTEVTTGELVTDGGCSYGSNFADYDNDGDLDLAVSNGFYNGQILNFLYLNDGQGNFARDLESAEDLTSPCSYGVAWGDVNNDGFQDLAFATCKNSGAAPNPADLFYLNNGNCNNWLKIKLQGTASNRSAIGAKVWVKATPGAQQVTQLREISAQSGHCGQNSLVAHFGLGAAAVAEEVRVKFLGGEDTILTGVPVNQLLEITEALPTGTTEAFAHLHPLVSPNPASDSFNVSLHLQKPETVTVRLSDSRGQVVLEKKMAAAAGVFSENFSRKGLAAGQYFLTVQVGEAWATLPLSLVGE